MIFVLIEIENEEGKLSQGEEEEKKKGRKRCFFFLFSLTSGRRLRAKGPGDSLEQLGRLREGVVCVNLKEREEKRGEMERRRAAREVSSSRWFFSFLQLFASSVSC